MGRSNRVYAAALSAIATSLAIPAAAQDLLWTRQLGTAEWDRSQAVAVDSAGNVYISGHTAGSLGGPHQGGWDAFLAKYDSAGNLLWMRQLGTSEGDDSAGLAVDNNGDVYISGYTEGSLGGDNQGVRDAYLAKYDGDGNLLWARQLGTAAIDYGVGAAVDSDGGVYIGGMTLGSLGGPQQGEFDAFVARYDSAGNLLWTRQFGTPGLDSCGAITTDSAGNVYINGATWGDLGGPNQGGQDAYVAKFDSAGNLLWTRQLGTAAFDSGSAVATDGSGSVYISGGTDGNLGGDNQGERDAYLAKYDSAGTLLWTRQLGTSARDRSLMAAVDDAGGVYITGDTTGSLGGPNQGDKDFFLSKYDSTGNLLWMLQHGTTAEDAAYSVVADRSGSVYISGYTGGSLGGPHQGGLDAFLAKYHAGNEPCLPDLNGDGTVDTQDFIQFLNLWAAGDDLADWNTDGVVNTQDFIAFLNDWSGAHSNGCP